MRPNAVPVCVFAKPPLPGHVKTRLIPAFSAQAAAELAVAMLVDTWAVVNSCPYVRPVLACTAKGDFPVVVRQSDLWLQPEGDLGARLESILSRALAGAPAAIAIGADAPLLTINHLKAAINALQTNDAVLGPSTDGGFYLLGLSHCPAGMLSGLPWSTVQTGAATKTRLLLQSFSIAELSKLSDIDTADDVCVLAKALDRLPPATRAWFTRHLCYAC